MLRDFTLQLPLQGYLVPHLLDEIPILEPILLLFSSLSIPCHSWDGISSDWRTNEGHNVQLDKVITRRLSFCWAVKMGEDVLSGQMV